MNRSKGFTLAELAVALVIIGLLLAGALIPLSTQIEVRNVSDTQRTMDQIKEAIIGFAQANGRLPCPANGSTPDGTVDATSWPTAIAAGAEQWDTINNRCYTTFGVVSWSSLGVPETDAWGRRFSYRVSPIFADAIAASTWVTLTTTTPASQGNQPTTGCSPPTPVPALSTFALCSLGDIAVLTRTESATAATVLGTALPAVIISHGKNGYSAWQTNGIRVMPPASGGDEIANASLASPPASATGAILQGIGGGANAFASWTFYSRIPTPTSGCSDPAPGAAASTSPLCEFDDIVVMISSNVLIARMVSAGRLP